MVRVLDESWFTSPMKDRSEVTLLILGGILRSHQTTLPVVAHAS